METLQEAVRTVYKCLKKTEKFMSIQYDYIEEILPKEIFFITSQELEDHIRISPRKKENIGSAKRKGAVFIMQIGDLLTSGIPHDGRAPDYDDWALNGDILVYYPILDIALELSSMGIRVDENSLAEQLKKSGCEDRAKLPLPEGCAGKRAALHHRRRHRSVPYLYVLPAQGSYRRSAVFSVARMDRRRMQKKRHSASVMRRP